MYEVFSKKLLNRTNMTSHKIRWRHCITNWSENTKTVHLVSKILPMCLDMLSPEKQKPSVASLPNIAFISLLFKVQ